ncbi:MAG: hypothetical protein SVU32_00245 [Candidatus Nanohaloarchaea archaeon]|nr:hypothetical protein [Candidatus Nanohaloarchaea archaeon]
MNGDERLYDTFEFPEPGAPRDLVETVVDAIEQVDGYRPGKRLGYGTHDGDSFERIEMQEQPANIEGRERLFRWPYEFAIEIPASTDEAEAFQVRYRDNQSIWYDDVDEDAVDDLVEAINDANFFKG